MGPHIIPIKFVSLKFLGFWCSWLNLTARNWKQLRVWNLLMAPTDTHALMNW